jgi:predicted transcriptional regulator
MTEAAMAETTTITVRVPVALKQKLDRLAGATRRSRSFLAAEALEIYTRYELEIVEGILRGIEDVEAGRVVPHEEAMAEARAIIAKARARKQVASQPRRAVGR